MILPCGGSCSPINACSKGREKSWFLVMIRARCMPCWSVSYLSVKQRTLTSSKSIWSQFIWWARVVRCGWAVPMVIWEQALFVYSSLGMTVYSELFSTNSKTLGRPRVFVLGCAVLDLQSIYEPTHLPPNALFSARTVMIQPQQPATSHLTSYLEEYHTAHSRPRTLTLKSNNTLNFTLVARLTRVPPAA